MGIFNRTTTKPVMSHEDAIAILRRNHEADIRYKKAFAEHDKALIAMYDFCAKRPKTYAMFKAYIDSSIELNDALRSMPTE